MGVAPLLLKVKIYREFRFLLWVPSPIHKHIISQKRSFWQIWDKWYDFRDKMQKTQIYPTIFAFSRAL